MKTVVKISVSTGKTKFKIILDKIEKILLIDVKSKPEKDKANKEIIKELKKFFKSEVKIISGFKNKKKIIEIYSEKEKILKKLEP
jgi:uncharacterized protein